MSSVVSYGAGGVRAVNHDCNTFAALYDRGDGHTLVFTCPFDAGGVGGERCSLERLRAFPGCATFRARNRACDVEVVHDPTRGGTTLRCELAAARGALRWDPEARTLECHRPGADGLLASLDLASRTLRLYDEEDGWLAVWVRHGFPSSDLRLIFDRLLADDASDSSDGAA